MALLERDLREREREGGMVDESVKIPAQAVSPTGEDLKAPLRALLEDLSLLGPPDKVEEAGHPKAAFTGPAQSVAVIEAGATALSKWWSVTLGGSTVALWGAVVHFWNGEPESVRRFLVVSVGVVTAALVLAIAYIVGSDVTGRAAGMVATIEARARLADTMVREAQRSYIAAPTASARQIVPLPTPLGVSYVTREKSDEDDWRALAFSDVDGTTQFLVVKGHEQEWVDAGELRFE